MKKMKVDLAVIGGGPAGMAAALEAKRQGVEKVIIIERDKKLGGILQQCIHDGFGIQRFGERLREQNMRSVLSTRSKRAILRCF